MTEIIYYCFVCKREYHRQEVRAEKESKLEREGLCLDCMPSVYKNIPENERLRIVEDTRRKFKPRIIK